MNPNLSTLAKVTVFSLYAYQDPSAMGVMTALALVSVMHNVEKCVKRRHPANTANHLFTPEQRDFLQAQRREQRLSEALLLNVNPILNGLTNQTDATSLRTSIEQGSYNRALRQACTSKNADVLPFIIELLKHRAELSINIHEKNSTNQSAWDLANANTTHRNVFCQALHEVTQTEQRQSIS